MFFILQFNGIHKAPESDKLERLILDVDPETKEPVIEVDTSIVRHLKPHQAEGIKFMYNACFESIEMIKENKVPGGCILAHCMGLGKTLQVCTGHTTHCLLLNYAIIWDHVTNADLKSSRIVVFHRVWRSSIHYLLML